MPPEIKYTGPERRLDPEGCLLSDVHAAARALDRFRGPQAEDIETAQFRERGEARASFQRKMRGLLDKVDGKLSPEQQRLVELVEAQYRDEVSLSRDFELVGSRDLAPPSADHASELLLTQLSREQVAAFFKLAEQPQFQLEPLIAFSQCVKALDAHKRMPEQKDTYVKDLLKNKLAAQDNAAGISDIVSGWRLGVFDAEEELDEDPKLRGLLLGQQVVQNGAIFQQSGLRRLHPRRYAFAQMRAIRDGKPLDGINWSVLDDDSGDLSVVPGGNWLDFRVYFSVYRPAYKYDNARFRPEVVVNIPGKFKLWKI